MDWTNTAQVVQVLVVGLHVVMLFMGYSAGERS